MSADQTLRAAIIMRLFEFTYEYSSKIEQNLPSKGREPKRFLGNARLGNANIPMTYFDPKTVFWIGECQG